MEQNSTPVQPPVNNQESKCDCQDGSCTSNSKICAILSYLLIGIIWYFLDDEMKKDQFAKFHVKQALVLAAASIIIQVVGTAIPLIGWFILLPLGNLLVLVLFVIGVANAACGKSKALPLIGQFSQKLNF